MAVVRLYCNLSYETAWPTIVAVYRMGRRYCGGGRVGNSLGTSATVHIINLKKVCIYYLKHLI